MNPAEKSCCRRRRGRPRSTMVLENEGRYRCYAPLCRTLYTDQEAVILQAEEMEVLRLVDLEGRGQEEAAIAIGISRRTLWKDLHEARSKVADALVNGKTIRVEGCMRKRSETCPPEGE